MDHRLRRANLPGAKGIQWMLSVRDRQPPGEGTDEMLRHLARLWGYEVAPTSGIGSASQNRRPLTT